MRSILGAAFIATSIGMASTQSCRADVATLSPVADAFVASASPNSNYGAAGALAISAPGLAHGEFQSVMRFDTTTAVAGFNTSYGPGNWTIQSAILQFTAAPPNNSIFNTQAAGQFAVRWMQNDSWSQGSGTPMSPSSSGITFSTLPASWALGRSARIVLVQPAPRAAPRPTPCRSQADSHPMPPRAGLSRSSCSPPTASSRMCSTPRSSSDGANRPELVITAVPAPAAGGLILAGISSFSRRSRHRQVSDRLRRRSTRATLSPFRLGAAARDGLPRERTMSPCSPPGADAFVAASNPTSNYGGASRLAVAAPGLAQGEFQSVLRFDTSGAIAAFDSSLGAGHWSIQSVTLALNAMNPVNLIFNQQAAGSFTIRWTVNNAWVEGIGMPNTPGSTGVTFDTLPTFLSSDDELLGTFTTDGSITGFATYPLALTPGFLSGLTAGGPVGLHLAAADNAVGYLFNSRNFNNPAAWPVLTITAISSCPADFNGVDGLNVQDIFDFLAAWFAGDPRADFNGVGGITVQDIFDFLAAWFAGC